MALLLKHQTAEQFVARVRAAYAREEGERLISVASYVLAAIAAGDLTDAQLRAAFGKSVAAWNTLKVKMQNMVTARATVRGAQGE